MTCCLPRFCALKSIAPPLEPDLPESGLAHLVCDTGQFPVQGKECEEIMADRCWSKERGDRAIKVCFAGHPLDSRRSLPFVHGMTSNSRSGCRLCLTLTRGTFG